MDKGAAGALTIVVGSPIALQAPINSALGKQFGTFATAAVLVDRAGALGLERQAITAPRLAGILLLAAGTFLIVRY